MKAPPLLPEETLPRVLRTARKDGFSVMAVAGFLTLAAASVGDFQGAAIGLLVTAAGAIELHGAGLLRAGDPRGMNWLIASQPYLMAVLLGYCAFRLWSFDPILIREALTDEVRISIEQAGYNEEQFVRMVYKTTYIVLAIGTVLFQGAMTLYYWRRRDAVVAVLAESDDPET